MLSQPIPPDEATSDAIILSNISSMTSDTFFFFGSSSPTKFTASYELKQSQIPSQARIKNDVSPGTNLSFLISGKAVIIWSFTATEDSVLYSKSPRDLDKAKIPLTRLSSTKPPALSILYFSSGRSGL